MKKVEERNYSFFDLKVVLQISKKLPQPPPQDTRPFLSNISDYIYL